MIYSEIYCVFEVSVFAAIFARLILLENKVLPKRCAYPTNCRRLCEETRIMTSYRNEVGAWDGGPPGAEGDYAPQPAPPLSAPMPTTDPWTGVSYTQYPSNYDYNSYGAPQYGFGYDSSYYRRADSYYDGQSNYAGQYHSSYGYTKSVDQPSGDSRIYSHRRPSYKSKSRSISPYDRRDREYSKRESSYDRKSKTRSKKKYTPSRSSSRSKSRSYSRSPITRKRRSEESDVSKKSYRRSSRSASEQSLTTSARKKSKSYHRSSSESSGRRSRSKSPKYRNKKGKRNSPMYKADRSRSISPRIKLEKHGSKSPSPKIKQERDKSVSPNSKSKDRVGVSQKGKDKRSRNSSPFRQTVKSPPTQIKLEKRSITPSRSHTAYDKTSTSQRKSQYKGRSLIPDRPRDSSVTPPRCYARSPSSSKSRSSRSLTPGRRSRNRSRRRSSSSSSNSYSRKRSRSRSKTRSKRKSMSKDKSRSRSPTYARYRKNRSLSRHRLRARRSSSIRRSKSRSRSHSAHSSSRSGTQSPSEDERRGQFTVADRKRYWKLHRHNQRGRVKSPKEIKAPPGAIEITKLDDIDYGDPPEVEGPNFAELLPPPGQVAIDGPSSSKANKAPLPIPIKNDGSFLEMFKKLQEETKKQEEVKKPEIKKPVLPFIGKRRGGRVLKTGLVKKAKAIDEQTVDNTPKDAWSLYMQEVKKYRETSCEEERKTRPLVK